MFLRYFGIIIKILIKLLITGPSCLWQLSKEVVPTMIFNLALAYPSRHTTSFQLLHDVYTTSLTSYRRRIDVETTSYVYWDDVKPVLARQRFY